MSDNNIVSFDDTEFEGNEYEIKYKIDVKDCEPQKLLKFNIYVVSNGGELTIPVFIKVLKEIFYTDDGYKIVTMKDLFSYSKKKPEKAAEVFCSDKFIKWLIKIDFERIDIMRMFLCDNIKERAIDNFFIFCKLKKKSYIEVIEKNINIHIKPFQTEKIKGSIVILKKGYGYIERKINFKYGCDFIRFDKKYISANDFNDENRCYINFEINPSLILNNFSRECVIIDENTNVKIDIFKLPIITVNLSQEIYEYEEFGTIIIENNCEKDLVFEFTAKDNFIEFESRHCVISNQDNVLFKIKRSKIKNLMSMVSFNKKLYTKTEIYVKTVFDGQIIKKTKEIFLGNSLI